jgi:hypothetical protein
MKYAPRVRDNLPCSPTSHALFIIQSIRETGKLKNAEFISVSFIKSNVKI